MDISIETRAWFAESWEHMLSEFNYTVFTTYPTVSTIATQEVKFSYERPQLEDQPAGLNIAAVSEVLNQVLRKHGNKIDYLQTVPH